MVNTDSNYTPSPQEIIDKSKYLVSKKKHEFAKKLKSSPTEAEVVFQQILEDQGYRFRTQTIVLGYIVDFYLPDIGLIIEVDGQSHNKEKDIKRDLILEQSGFVVLRITNYQAKHSPFTVFKEIKRIGNLIGRLANPK